MTPTVNAVVGLSILFLATTLGSSFVYIFGKRIETRTGQSRSDSKRPGDGCGARVRAVERVSETGVSRNPLQNKRHPFGCPS